LASEEENTSISAESSLPYSSTYIRSISFFNSSFDKSLYSKSINLNRISCVSITSSLIALTSHLHEQTELISSTSSHVPHHFVYFPHIFVPFHPCNLYHKLLQYHQYLFRFAHNLHKFGIHHLYNAHNKAFGYPFPIY